MTHYQSAIIFFCHVDGFVHAFHDRTAERVALGVPCKIDYAITNVSDF